MLHHLLFLLFFLPNTAHQFHVSKSQIEYNSEDKALQISVHIFLDDLEIAIEERGGGKTFLCTERETKDAVAILKKYLQSQLKINVDGAERPFIFLGKELSEDLAAIWCYLEIPDLETPASLEVTNQILMDLYDDQKNIVHIIGPNQQTGYFMMQKGKSTERVEF
ncbi:MAG: DUF6702 family protein [Saprospiraceae bacterium]